MARTHSAIVAAVFNGPHDQVEAVRWDAPMHTLTDAAYC